MNSQERHEARYQRRKARREQRAQEAGGASFEEEIELLERKWAHFLRQDVEVILFNEDFFAAAVPELKELADALHIKVRR